MSNVKVYTPESMIKKPGALIAAVFYDLIQGNQLAWRLAVRDSLSQYRQSFLGVIWAFLLPLTNTITWIMLRKTGVVGVGATDLPYPIYVFTGSMLWAAFIESLQAPLIKTVANRGLLAKINFPREALVMSSVYQSLLTTGAKVVVMLVGMILLGYNFMTVHFLLFPLGVIAVIIVGTAIGLIFTPLGVLYNDVGKGIPLAAQFLMYLTPVVYPIPATGWVRSLMEYNPATPLIMAARDWTTGNQSIFASELLIVTGVSLVVFFLMLVVYRVAMPILIERVSS